MVDNQRRVRSYVIRAARMSDAQKRAYAESAPRWVLPFGGSVDPDRLFPDAEKFIVEIGFGMGDATRKLASMKPEWGILGVEVHRPGVGKLLWWIEKEGLNNLRIVEHDAVEVVSSMLKDGSVDGFHVWFPDPWPKKRHHKRRLIDREFAEMALKALKVGGYVHIATDWEPYADRILEVLEGTPGLANRYERWAPKPDYRPDTKFEGKGIAADRVIRDIIFDKESS